MFTAYPSLECLTYHQNRVIYSDPANASNYLSDAWRVFRPGNYYDFPKQGGRLIDLNAGENERVYARFENTTKVYNSRITLSTTSPYQLEIGNAEMFKQKPVELSKTDLGYIGTQHKAYVKCEYGTFWVDAKRGHIYQITGEGFNEIKTENNFNWFKNNLPFNILKNFPDADIDNPQSGLMDGKYFLEKCVDKTKNTKIEVFSPMPRFVSSGISAASAVGGGGGWFWWSWGWFRWFWGWLWWFQWSWGWF